MIIVEKRLPNVIGVNVTGFDDRINSQLRKWITPFWRIEDSAHNKIVLTIMPNFRENDITLDGNICYIGIQNSTDRIINAIVSQIRIFFKLCAKKFSFENLHSACIAYNNIGVLIDAPRNNGKTTVILRAISSFGFSLIANDQVMFNRYNNTVYGYPATVGIRTNSLNENLSKKVLWRIKDPYMTEKKPIIHITDLAKECGSELYSQTKSAFLISYLKSNNYNTLHIQHSSYDYQQKLNSMKLPLTSAYKCGFVNFYSNLVDRNVVSSDYTNTTSGYKLRFLTVECGKNRIEDFLGKLRMLLMKGENDGDIII